MSLRWTMVVMVVGAGCATVEPDRVREYRNKDSWTLAKRCARRGITPEQLIDAANTVRINARVHVCIYVHMPHHQHMRMGICKYLSVYTYACTHVCT